MQKIKYRLSWPSSRKSSSMEVIFNCVFCHERHFPTYENVIKVLSSSRFYLQIFASNFYLIRAIFDIFHKGPWGSSSAFFFFQQKFGLFYITKQVFLISSCFATFPVRWVAGWVCKLKLRLSSDQRELELGLSLAKIRLYP